MAIPQADFTLKLRDDQTMRLSDPNNDNPDPPSEVLNTPTDFRVTVNGTNTQTLAWSYSWSNHEGFSLEWKVPPATSYSVLSDSLAPSARSAVVDGLPADTLISYRIRGLCHMT